MPSVSLWLPSSSRGQAMEADQHLIDDEMEPDPTLNRITNAIIGAAMKSTVRIGPGHLESAYEEAMMEMTLHNISVPPAGRRRTDVQGQGGGQVPVRLPRGRNGRPGPQGRGATGGHSHQSDGLLSITGHPLGLLIISTVRPAPRHQRIARRREFIRVWGKRKDGGSHRGRRGVPRTEPRCSPFRKVE